MNILILEDTSTFVEEFVDILKNNNRFPLKNNVFLLTIFSYYQNNKFNFCTKYNIRYKKIKNIKNIS